MEKEIVKIKTVKGRIITLSISDKSVTHIFGYDKFGQYVIVPKKDIDSMYPLKEVH